MYLKLLFLTSLMTGCTNTVAGVGNWRYESTESSGLANLPLSEVTALIRRAESDFSASPAYPDGPRPISAIRAGRRPDGTILIMFSVGGVADSRAIYVFNPGGDIADRYLRSSWGAR